jgi:hypothetical protein
VCRVAGPPPHRRRFSACQTRGAVAGPPLGEASAAVGRTVTPRFYEVPFRGTVVPPTDRRKSPRQRAVVTA